MIATLELEIAVPAGPCENYIAVGYDPAGGVECREAGRYCYLCECVVCSECHRQSGCEAA